MGGLELLKQLLLDVLKSRVTFLTGSDLHNVLYVVYEDFTVSDIARIENLLGGLDDGTYRNLADDNLYLDLRQEVRIDLYAAVELI